MPGEPPEHPDAPAAHGRPAGGDLFPPTESGYLLDAVHGRAPEHASAYVMRVYLRPLAGYFSASSYRSIGAPEDVVAGFFADRLGRPDWITRWFEERRKTAIRFSRWLLTSFHHYLHEEMRRRKKAERQASMDPALLDAMTEGAARGEAEEDERLFRGFERERARALLAEAIRRAKELPPLADRAVDFSLFEEHFVERKEYAAMAAERGVDTVRVKNDLRVATARIRAMMERLLLDEGIPREEMEAEIRSLMAAVQG